jgi:ABC-2 type transport system ATP-binding protein
VTDAEPLRIRGLVMRFGSVHAVDGLDLTVHAGSALALVGRNGAGKSTTMRAAAGVLPPHDGTVHVSGHDAARDPEGAKACLGYCPDVGGLIPRATPWEHLQLAARMRGLPSGWETRGRDLLTRFDLAAAADRVTAGFSHGMGRRLSVLLAAFHDPDLVLLDEPFDGVDPLGVDATLALIQEQRERGAGIVVSTHLLDLAVEACDQAAVISEGRTVRVGPADGLAGAEGASTYRRLITSTTP